MHAQANGGHTQSLHRWCIGVALNSAFRLM
jgi:hypothetical protein